MAKKARKPPVERTLDSDEMGGIGEEEFSGLCRKGHLVANDSKRNDKMGWDFLVEFPHPHTGIGERFETRRKLPDIKVQVKTIWADHNSVDVGLSALDRIAGWDYPSFVALFRINPDKTLKDLHLIHLLGENLARVLEALRKSDAEGSLTTKNKTLSFGIKHGTAVPLDGDALATAFTKAYGEDPGSYIIRKRAERESLGFAARPFNLSFSLAAKNTEEVLDFQLGLRRGTATEIEVTETRFGVTRVVQQDASGVVEVRPQSVTTCELVITSTVGDRRRVIFDGELFIARVGTVRSRRSKIRFRSTTAELVFAQDADEGNFTIGLSPDMRVPIREMISVARLQYIMALGRGTAVIRHNHKRLMGFTIDKVPMPDLKRQAEYNTSFYTGIETLLAQVGKQDLPISTNDIEATFDSIRFALNAQRSRNGIRLRLRVFPNSETPAFPKKVEGIFASRIVFPTCTIAFWAIMEATAEQEAGAAVTLTCTKFLLRDVAMAEDDEGFHNFVDGAAADFGVSLVVKMDRVNWVDDPDPPVIEGEVIEQTQWDAVTAPDAGD